MGKVQKRKNPDGPRKNRNKGINSKKRGPLWAIRRYKKDNGDIGTYRVYVPPNAQWDFDRIKAKSVDESGLKEPFDSLYLDWTQEMKCYANEVGGRIERYIISPGRFNYAVVITDEFGEDKVIFEVESSKSLNFGNKKKFKKRIKIKSEDADGYSSYSS